MKSLVLFFIATISPLLLWSQYVDYERYWRCGLSGIDFYGLHGSVSVIKSQNYKASGDTIRWLKASEINSPQTHFGVPEYISFDKKGRLITEGSIFENETDPFMNYSYQDNSKSFISEGYPGFGSLNFQLKHLYKSKPLRLEIEESHSEIPGINKKHLIYYTKDSVVDYIERYNSKNELIFLYKFTSDNEGNVLDWQEFPYGTNPGNKHVFVYDNNNLLIKHDWFYHGELELTKKYQYDMYGNIIAERIDDLKGSRLFTMRYEYDENENWIERILFVDGEAREVCQRTITYY